MYIQLNCCTQNKGIEATRLESHPTRNGDVHDDNLDIQSNGKSERFNDQPQSCWCPDLQYIIIDMAPVAFIDSCGSKMLERVSIHIISSYIYKTKNPYSIISIHNLLFFTTKM